MKIGIFSFVVLCAFIFTTNLYGQQDRADSLQEQIKYLNGEKKVEALNELADIYQYINTKTAIDYALKGIELAKAINYQKGLAGCYGSLGFCYTNIDINKAVDFTKKALEIRYKIGDEAGIATSLNVLGVIYYYQGDYLTSIEYHMKALKMRENIGDEIKIATSYNNIALVYMALEEFDTALEYLNKALDIRTKNNNKKGIAVIKGNLGDIYNRLGDNVKALKYLDEALKTNIEIGNIKSEAGIHLIIAKIFKQMGNVRQSLNNYLTANALYANMDEKHGMSQTEIGIASIYIDQGKINLAIDHALTSLKFAESINSVNNIARAADILQSAFQKNGNYKEAYKYLTLYKNSSDSLKVTDKIKKLSRSEFNYKLEKIKEVQKIEIAKQQIFIKWLIVTLVLSLIIVSLIIFGYFHKKKINNQLSELNDKLTELNSTKDRFFSIIAHDLRGPFHTLLGFSEILSTSIDSMSNDEIKESYTKINQTLKSQFELLDNLLDWSRLQIENFNIVLEKISLYEELNKTIESLSLTAQEKKINLVNLIPENIKVYADKNMLQLVLRNLIINSIKFSYQDSEVKISAKQKEKFVEIGISDNGVGISKNDFDKIFRIDVHYSTSGTSDEKGTGLGLILCKEIIEKHEGEIWISGEKGKGTNVSFTLKTA